MSKEIREKIVRISSLEQNEDIPMHEISESLVCTENWESKNTVL